jgi:hypothetical protein
MTYVNLSGSTATTPAGITYTELIAPVILSIQQLASQVTSLSSISTTGPTGTYTNLIPGTYLKAATSSSIVSGTILSETNSMLNVAGSINAIPAINSSTSYVFNNSSNQEVLSVDTINNGVVINQNSGTGSQINVLNSAGYSVFSVNSSGINVNNPSGNNIFNVNNNISTPQTTVVGTIAQQGISSGYSQSKVYRGQQSLLINAASPLTTLCTIPVNTSATGTVLSATVKFVAISIDSSFASYSEPSTVGVLYNGTTLISIGSLNSSLVAITYTNTATDGIKNAQWTIQGNNLLFQVAGANTNTMNVVCTYEYFSTNTSTM